MNKRTLQLLESKNVSDRKQAVKELAQSRDMAAMPYLKDVFQNDPDADVRELARKAAIYIRQKVKEEQTYTEPDDEDDDDQGYVSFSQRAMMEEEAKPQEPTSGIQPGPIQNIMAWLVVIGGFAALVGYFLLPWLDLSDVEQVDTSTGAVITLGEQIDFLKLAFNVSDLSELREFFPSADQLIDSVNGLTATVNGLDTTLIMLDARTIFGAIGFESFIDAGQEFMIAMGAADDPSLVELDAMLTAYPDYGTGVLDFTMLLIPLASAAGIMLGVVLLVEGKLSMWFLTIACGIVGLAPAAYFYFSGLDKLLLGDVDVMFEGIAAAQIPPATEFAGLGFYVTVVGMGLVLFAPFIGLLLMPGEKHE